MDRIIKPGSLMSASIHIKVGDQISVDKLKEQLISIGYEKNYGVEEAGHQTPSFPKAIHTHHLAG